MKRRIFRRLLTCVLFVVMLVVVLLPLTAFAIESRASETATETDKETSVFAEFIGIDALTQKLDALSGIEGNLEQGKARVALLNQLSALWREKDPDKADAYNQEALVLAQRIDDPLGVTAATLQKAYSLIGKGQYGDGVLLLDSVYNELSLRASHWLLVSQKAMLSGKDVYLEADVSSLLKKPLAGYNFSDGSFTNEDLHWAVIAGQFKNAYGLVWSHLGDASRSQQSFEEAYAIYLEVQFPRGVAQSLHNLSVVFTELGGYDRAAKLDLDALRIFEALGYADEIADVTSNLARINQLIGSPDVALDYLSKALGVYEVAGDKRGQAIVNGRLGDYFAELGLADEAMQAFQEALVTFGAFDDKLNSADIHLKIGKLYESSEDYEGAIASYNLAREMYLDEAERLESEGIEVAQSAREGLVVAANNRGTAHYNLGQFGDALAAHQEAYAQAERLAYRDGLSAALFNLAQDYSALNRFEEANEAMQLYIALKDYVLEESVLEKTQQQQVLYDTEKKERALVAEQVAKAEEEAKRRRWSAVAVASILMLSLISVLLALVARERKRSEKLLLNILPKKVASDLKRFGKAPSERFDEVTVYFSDVVNFTTASSTMDPEFLISELNEIFTTFDAIMESHGCERIKTIGDAYMAVCGMPIPRDDHAKRMLAAAREIREALKVRNASSAHQWEIRIGIHSGKVVGGIVGVKKYIYDVFGDTINTASRMESNSVPMGINVSEATYTLLKEEKDFTFIDREPIEVKGKGEMKMYFAE